MYIFIGSALNSSIIGTTQQQQHYYPTYQQPMPSYIYDAPPYSAYSPVQQNVQHTFHQTPGNNQQINNNHAIINNIMSSPQQSSFLASYQTPPPPPHTAAHQLYIQTTAITPATTNASTPAISSQITSPTSLSPNDTTGTESRTSDCHSPNPTSTLQNVCVHIYAL